MTGPFPGMDPYLEAQGLWERFHAALVTNCAQALNQRLPEGYVTRIARGEVEVREWWIEISSLPELELMTVIEILSPSNKSGSGRSEYLQKRDALIDQPVNLVEIDLLLGGRPMPMGKNLPAGHYHAVVVMIPYAPKASDHSAEVAIHFLAPRTWVAPFASRAELVTAPPTRQRSTCYEKLRFRLPAMPGWRGPPAMPCAELGINGLKSLGRDR